MKKKSKIFISLICIILVFAIAYAVSFALPYEKKSSVMAETFVSTQGCGENDYKEKQIYIDKKFGLGVAKIKSNAGIKKNYNRFEKLHIKD